MLDTIRTMRLMKTVGAPAAPAPASNVTVLGFTPKQVLNLQRGTRGVLIFGIAASVAANVLHSLTRPEAASDPTWKIASGAALSALAPLVLFACIELVSRIPVQSRVRGALRLVVTFAVGGFAGWVSYWHMESVAESLGESGTAKYFYPLIIDGMMLVATISLIELARLGTTVQRVVTATVAAEAAAAEAASVLPATTAARKPDQAELDARKRARYDTKSPADKLAWTKKYRKDLDAKALREAAKATQDLDDAADLLAKAGPLDDAPVSGAPVRA